MNPQNSPYTTGYAFGKSMKFKLGDHEGSPGHPINMERSGDFHKMKAQFAKGPRQDDFVEGYRDAWTDYSSRKLR